MSPRPWHEQDPDAYERLKLDLAEFYPTLHPYIVKDCIVIQGSFPIEYKGQELDRFKVKVVILPSFPKDPPVVFETGGRIPRTLERHVYPKLGNCCLFHSDAFRIRYPNGMPFLDFLRGPIRDYFLGQLAVEAGQPWPFGELGHGKQGAIQYFEEEFDVKGEQAVLNCLDYISYSVLKGHHRCPCGSTLRLRNCHWAKLNELRNRIPREVALDASKRLKTMDSVGKR